MAAEIVFMALLGLIAGSFLSVVAHRVPLGESIVAPRSRCPNCGTQIAAYDNIPLFSYLALRGRCRHCDAKVPATYPLLEAGLAAVFVAILLRYSDDGIEIALGACLAATLATITLTDLEHRVIPNKVLIVAALVAVGLLVAGDRDALAEHAIAAAIAFAVMFLIAIVYPRGMGMGDVKLAGVMGLYLGKAVAPALLIGFAAGALFGLALIASRGAEARKQAVPFGPFLALGGLVAIFVGPDIVDWYTDTFFPG
ncbi:MAG TPA: prepilin peptidase [Solirubrobacterales bacterium]|nr:prepilin peptidase [Solirubrobacterales bacterium]